MNNRRFPTASPNVLEADGIRVAFGPRQLLSGVYLRVQTGQIAGLLGRTGCGKSTLLQTVFGARTVPDASVRVNGHRTVHAFQTPGLLNYLPQAPLLPEHLTLRQAARLLGVDADHAVANFPELQSHLGSRPEALIVRALELTLQRGVKRRAQRAVCVAWFSNEGALLGAQGTNELDSRGSPRRDQAREQRNK
jgi:ABC-type nitrate/sulfonate/bicarbonate transport system ATPase subunit